jgi:hypothetical protein
VMGVGKPACEAVASAWSECEVVWIPGLHLQGDVHGDHDKGCSWPAMALLMTVMVCLMC